MICTEMKCLFRNLRVSSLMKLLVKLSGVIVRNVLTLTMGPTAADFLISGMKMILTQEVKLM
jgi:hypothetical protein